jgi:hypothetical protein
MPIISIFRRLQGVGPNPSSQVDEEMVRHCSMLSSWIVGFIGQNFYQSLREGTNIVRDQMSCFCTRIECHDENHDSSIYKLVKKGIGYGHV